MTLSGQALNRVTIHCSVGSESKEIAFRLKIKLTIVIQCHVVLTQLVIFIYSQKHYLLVLVSKENRFREKPIRAGYIIGLQLMKIQNLMLR